jgi:hypothetical protein
MAEPAGLLLLVLVAVAGGVSFSPFDAGLSKNSHGQDCLQSVFHHFCRKDRSSLIRGSSQPSSKAVDQEAAQQPESQLKNDNAETQFLH